MSSTLPKHTRRSLIAAAVAAAALVAPAVAAGQASPAGGSPPAAPSFPDSPLGRMGAELIAVVNGGDSAAIERFAAEHVGSDMIRGRGPAQVARTLRTLHAQSGGLDVRRLAEMEGALRIITQSRRGDRWLGIELVPAASSQSRIGQLGFHPLEAGGMRRPPAPWGSGAMSDERIAAIVRERVRAAADADRFSGVVVVAHGDRILVNEPVGFADRARGVRNTTGTLFATTSVGKMFAGVAIAQLVERGKLRLDDTLATLLPGYPDRAAAKRITVRQLLTHTAGVPEPFASPRWGSLPDDASHEALLATFAGAPHHDPRGAHHYSNGNYVTLAALVERIAGTSYEEYLRRNVWTPAGMRRVAHPGWSDPAGIAVPYARFSDTDPLGVEPRRAADASARAYRGPLRGFGGGSFTAEDLFRFARALRAGRLLGPEMTDTATRGLVEIGPGAPVRYALGFYDQDRDGVRIVGHRGSNPDTGWDSDVEMLWDGEWTVVVLSNYDAPAGIDLAYPILRLLGEQPAGGARQAAGR